MIILRTNFYLSNLRVYISIITNRTTNWRERGGRSKAACNKWLIFSCSSYRCCDCDRDSDSKRAMKIENDQHPSVNSLLKIQNNPRRTFLHLSFVFTIVAMQVYIPEQYLFGTKGLLWKYAVLKEILYFLYWVPVWATIQLHCSSSASAENSSAHTYVCVKHGNCHWWSLSPSGKHQSVRYWHGYQLCVYLYPDSDRHGTAVPMFKLLCCWAAITTAVLRLSDRRIGAGRFKPPESEKGLCWA